MERYFVVIFARDRDAMRSLQEFDLDVFPQTAKQGDRDADFPISIDGLLSMDEVERVVEAGYRVLIQEAAEKRARVGGKAAEFPEWLQGIEPTLKAERALSLKKRPSDRK